MNIANLYLWCTSLHT